MWSTAVLHNDDPAAEIVAFLADRPDALVVMATRSRARSASSCSGSVTEDLLRHSDHPILLVGPHALVDDPPATPTLVAGVDGRPASTAVLGAVASWSASFDGPPPWLVEVLPIPKEPPEYGDVAASSDVHRLATRLNEMGVAAEWEVTYARHPTDALIDFADRIADAVIVVASSRWTDADHTHLRSVARRLAHEAHHPVLVVRGERRRQADPVPDASRTAPRPRPPMGCETMRHLDDVTVLEDLPIAECLRLIATQRIGRVAFTVEAEPAVLPVNFSLVDDVVVFRTALGSAFDLLIRRAEIAFEVDHADPAYHSGWSVIGRGHGRGPGGAHARRTCSISCPSDRGVCRSGRAGSASGCGR